jgi:hypothetical protein
LEKLEKHGEVGEFARETSPSFSKLLQWFAIKSVGFSLCDFRYKNGLSALNEPWNYLLVKFVWAEMARAAWMRGEPISELGFG